MELDRLNNKPLPTKLFQGFCEDKELAILQNWVKAKLLASLAKWMNLRKWLQ